MLTNKSRLSPQIISTNSFNLRLNNTNTSMVVISFFKYSAVLDNFLGVLIHIVYINYYYSQFRLKYLNKRTWSYRIITISFLSQIFVYASWYGVSNFVSKQIPIYTKQTLHNQVFELVAQTRLVWLGKSIIIITHLVIDQDL